MTFQIEHDPTPSSHPTYRLVMLDDHNLPIGYATGEFRRYAVWYNGQPYFFLNTVTIPDKANRQQGLGTKLLKAVEEFARNKGAIWIRGQFSGSLTEATANQESERVLRNFWQKNGYGLKREVYDDCTRFWKPLQRQPKKR
ncbi:hypothetical protein BN8_03935 [Fibrisoma limi BUZ 3]|uniref:N-acetyltransferase domain-containing protein n=1 Tax=Fibrisoma limi BUZ 3 TaxID=1185876 RepID=I2GLF8_9BACT|nr:GNAT family N-acetyltransferase [Fibrisoma limi]CCH54734.1 hypothetical protein BN8_03935 [Fibrisoma limi BUZ 3]